MARTPEPRRPSPAAWVPTLYFAEGLPFYAVNFMALLFYQRGLGVNWIYATLIADYAVKNALLVWRFRSGRWMRLLPRATAAAPPVEHGPA